MPTHYAEFWRAAFEISLHEFRMLVGDTKGMPREGGGGSRTPEEWLQSLETILDRNFRSLEHYTRKDVIEYLERIHYRQPPADTPPNPLDYLGVTTTSSRTRNERAPDRERERRDKDRERRTTRPGEAARSRGERRAESRSRSRERTRYTPVKLEQRHRDVAEAKSDSYCLRNIKFCAFGEGSSCKAEEGCAKFRHFKSKEDMKKERDAITRYTARIKGGAWTKESQTALENALKD
jgi:hypothetical protein